VTVIFDLDHWYEVFQSLRRNRLRTILTACGVFWGVFMLVVMLGFGKGLENAVTADFANWAANTVFVWSDRTSKPYAGQQPGRLVQLTDEDAEAVAARIQGVELVLPRNGGGMRGQLSQVTRKDKTDTFGVSGELPDFLRLENMDIKVGRFLNPADVAERRKVAVIGSRVRENLFGVGEQPIGGSIRVGNVDYTVVGVYNSPSSGGGGRGDWINGRVFIPRTTYARSFGTGNKADYFAMLVAANRSSVEVEEEVRTLLKARHRVHPEDPRGVGSFNREKEFKKVSNLFLGISGLTWVVGLLTLVAGSIGVSNIMMITVSERTREIGIRKAIGATPMSIMVQIITEAVVLTALAGYLGLVAGVGVVEGAARIVASLPRGKGPSFFSHPEIELHKAVFAAVVLTVAGALAGLAPARSAVAVRPVEALAHE
jgi:putative ABC transport system permease protein